MRKYLMGTGLFGAITSGYSLLKGANHKRFTWRVALAWISWAITLLLAIGEARDIRTASHGGAVPEDSPIAGKEYKYAGTPKPGKKQKLDKKQKRAKK